MSHKHGAYSGLSVCIQLGQLFLLFAAASVWTMCSHAVELSMPLAGKHAGSVEINSVFDHSTPGNWYSENEEVTAFTGETGRAEWGANLDGYMQQSGEPFVVNGHYTAAGLGTQYLFYDGHPGLDFRTNNLSDKTIYAPADGWLYVPASDPVNGSPSTFNTLAIDHGDDWTTWYLHCASHTGTLPRQVTRGEAIAVAGDTGSEGSPHLHFEVRYAGTPVDPYGWQGTGPDPFTKETNYHLWADAIQVSGETETRKWWVNTDSGGDDFQFFLDLGYSGTFIKTVSADEADRSVTTVLLPEDY